MKKILVFIFILFTNINIIYWLDSIEISSKTLQYREKAINYKWNMEDKINQDISDFKKWYIKNNTQIEYLPYLHVRILDLLVWIWLIWWVLYLILKYLTKQ